MSVLVKIPKPFWIRLEQVEAGKFYMDEDEELFVGVNTNGVYLQGIGNNNQYSDPSDQKGVLSLEKVNLVYEVNVSIQVTGFCEGKLS